MILISPSNLVSLIALLVKHERLTTSGEILIGVLTTFDAKPAESWIAIRGAIYFESAVELRTKIDTHSFLETSDTESANTWAL